MWLRDGNVFSCWHSMWDVIWHGELGSSLALLNAGALGGGRDRRGRASMQRRLRYQALQGCLHQMMHLPHRPLQPIHPGSGLDSFMIRYQTCCVQPVLPDLVHLRAERMPHPPTHQAMAWTPS